MGEKNLNDYLKLINIKTINNYYKYILEFMICILSCSIAILGIPSDVINEHINFFNIYLPLMQTISFSTLIVNKYKKDKKEFIKESNLDFNTPVKECYEKLIKEEVIKENTPIEGIVDRYYINTESYLTQKGKRLVRKR